MDQLEYFRKFYDLGHTDYALLTEGFRTREFKKNDLIISPGQVQTELYFVQSGVQMSYYESDDKLHVIAFTYPPNLCAIPESFSFQVPSRHFLKCVTDSQFSYLKFSELETLFARSQNIERLFRKMSEAILAGVINRHIELNALTMEQRYRSFCKRSPNLLQLVPHKYIASYLGIDSTNFSKLYNSVRI
jgi:CRP-like cAMP-binding protein